MSAPVEMWSFLLYILQQVGILLGVGAEILLLVAYLLSIRDASVHPHEEHFALSLRRVVDIGLFFIITSGAAITYTHIMMGQGAVVRQPAFLFKWLLIWVAFAAALLHRKITVKSGLVEGAAGGAWLALLAIHIAAPVSTWSFLLLVFAIWMIAFMTAWSLGIYFVSGKHISFHFEKLVTRIREKLAPAVAAPSPILVPMPPAPAVKEIPVPVPPLLPIPKPTPVAPAPLLPRPAPPIPQVIQSPPRPAPASKLTFHSDEAFPYKKTVVDPTNILHPHLTGENDQGIIGQITGMTPTINPMSMNTAEVTEHLPAVRVMPQSEEDLTTQKRGPIVKFG